MNYQEEGFDEFLNSTEIIGDTSGDELSPYDFDSSLSDGSIQTAKIRELSADKITTGTLNVGQSLSVDGTILVNDGNNDRVLIGYDKDGF